MKKKNEPAYSELYISAGRRTIAHSFNYAVNRMKIPLEEYIQKFLAFKYLPLMEKGDPHYLVGVSGTELALEVCNTTTDDEEFLEYKPNLEFWVGWILSYYQWSRNISYREIIEKFPVERFVQSFRTFHECSEDKMLEYMDSVIFGD